MTNVWNCVKIYIYAWVNLTQNLKCTRVIEKTQYCFSGKREIVCCADYYRDFVSGSCLRKCCTDVNYLCLVFFFQPFRQKKNPYNYALSCSKQFLKIYNLLWIKSRTLLVRLACIRFLIVCLQKYSQDVSCSYEWFMNYSGWHIHMLMSYYSSSNVHTY